ncbi:MAG: RICIN domain-containing protein, partial [Alphaproteobacteria bacterium]
LFANGSSAAVTTAAGDYQLVSAGSGKCAELYGFSQDNFAYADQWACWGGPNQRLQATPLADGYYELRFVHSNKCLEVLNWSRAPGAAVGQYACHGGDNQRWSGQYANGATFVVRNKFSGQCLDVNGAGRSDGVPLIQWPCHNGSNQQWRSDLLSLSATNVRVVSQTCQSDGRVSVSLAWQPSFRGDQWVDLSVYNNGFAAGTFANNGPLPGYRGDLTWNGITASTQHYLRVNTYTPVGWRPSSTLSFSTRSDCGGGGPATVVRTLPVSQSVVALTFDGGADAGYTTMILDTLKANAIKAGFGITGRWAEQYPELIKRIAADGHVLINHSYDHASFTGLSTAAAPLSASERAAQLSRTESIIVGLTGRSTKPYFRPPYGDYDASVNTDVGAQGYRYNVMWSLDSYGWRGWSAQEIVNRVNSLVQPGAIIIFHVGSASQDGPALQAIIDSLRQKGYSFSSLDQYFR